MGIIFSSHYTEYESEVKTAKFGKNYTENDWLLNSVG